MSTRVALRALLLLLPLIITAAPTPAQANPTVTIASGVIVGTVVRAPQEPSITALAYLGVPFASPPIRFAPPTPPKPYQTLQAHTSSPGCLQQGDSSSNGDPDFFNKALIGDLFPTPAIQSEDCLYLDIYTPRGASSTSPKAVFLWIHGGNLNTGGGSLPYFDGSSLAVNGDIIVITINYRLNMFGFSNSPEIPFNQQNSGFLDQRLALQWVRGSIEAKLSHRSLKVTVSVGS
jgi:acetylcholinesterase/carboxylesterase 2